MAAILRSMDWDAHRSCGVGLLVLLGVLLAGCPSTHFVRVDLQQPIDLEPEEALLAFHVDSDLPLNRLTLSGLVIDEPIPAGRHFWIARMHAGSYTWRAIRVADGPFRGRFRIRRSVYERPGELDFEILAGHLNYAGRLIVRKGRRWWGQRSISVRIRNHAAQALREIVRESPSLLDEFEVHTSGTSGDRFLEFYLGERARLAAREDAPSLNSARPEESEP